MTRTNIERAKEEALRFIERADAVLNDTRETRWITGSKLTGTLRRSSMDLTRSLADLRRSS